MRRPDPLRPVARRRCSAVTGRSLCLALACAWILALGVTGSRAGPLDNHWETWLSQAIEHRLDATKKLRLEHETRHYAGSNYYRHYDLLLEKRAFRHLTLSAAYRHLEYTREGAWTTEHRPQAAATLAYSWGRLIFDDRNTLEFRFFEAIPNVIRYKNTPVVAYLFQLGTWQVDPYLSADFAFDLTGAHALELGRLRMAAGVVVKPTKRLRVDMYFMRQGRDLVLDEGEVWDTFRVEGFEVRYSF